MIVKDSQMQSWGQHTEEANIIVQFSHACKVTTAKTFKVIKLVQSQNIWPDLSL